MSTQTEITRINTARNTIRTKLVEMGLATSTAKIDVLATAVENITDNGAVRAEVKEGETYTIPKGYHNGSGTVGGVAGGGNYLLQSKTVTPTKSQQNITPDAGSYGLSNVTVNAIPENYHDVSSVDAGASDVLANKKFVDAEGTLTAGTMPNNGAVNQKLNATTQSYTIPKGYHSGSGKVSITIESKDVTPTKETQTIMPTTGNVLIGVNVAAIPKNYITTDDATATAGQILIGASAYVDGEKVDGTMANVGAVSKTLDTETTEYTIPAGFHNGVGKVSIVPETKATTPTKSTQNIVPTEGKVLSKVTVNAIPDAYQDVTPVTAGAGDVLAGKKIVSSTGAVVDGTMVNNGAMNKSMDGLTVTSVTIPAGYTSGGTISLTDDIETALAAI